ncbi:DUF1403 family protein [Actibacterium lipolyticum]|uniref:DUF1403 family protein n=1 Tax=Actibacterium lipolyticum TaxID=1524263 RepID=A0A238L886_9RHOB|nr:DUF1403 family protein [Actibacterium lipolyticum]SMX51217.1 hypothetical protein COL8621_03747 [Actibacterium lipolyticum]
MKIAAKPSVNDTLNLHALPRWITAGPQGTIEDVAFASGAALAMVDIVLRDGGGNLPAALLRDRLAMKAALACLKLEGRNETESDIRDAVCLSRPGDALGPAGDMFAGWRHVARLNLGISVWVDGFQRSLPEQMRDQLSVSDLMRAGHAHPVAHAADVLSNVLTQFPREEAAALMLADICLARGVGWPFAVPIFAAHLTRRNVRDIANGQGDALFAAHTAVIAGSGGILGMASDLTRRMAKIRTIAPKLRAKGADDAVALFLRTDAVSPSIALSNLMSDRAARRLCDRLVDLGAVKELTGRPTFRLYGV